MTWAGILLLTGEVALYQEHTLYADVDLVTTTRDPKPWSRPPIQMSFQVGHLSSGMHDVTLGP